MAVKAPVQVPCPWHHDEMQRLLDQHASGRLPHALLFGGSAGIGKYRLAQSLAQALLCRRPSGGLACGDCDACHLSVAGTHPDAQILAPEAGSQTIKIDQVRRLVEFCSRTASHQGGARVALIAPAEALNRNAQNALLKTLEEPGEGLVLLLVSHQPSLLLPTIRSRCQQRHLPLPAAAAALDWLSPQVGERAAALLAAAGGAPLAALALEEADWFGKRGQLAGQLVAVARGRVSPSQGAQALAAFEPRIMAPVIYGWLARASRLAALGGDDDSEIRDPGVEPALRELAACLPAARLLRAAQGVMEGRRQILAGANPNKELLMEQWLLALNR